MAKIDLSAARLREVLNYDPNTGVFTWRQTASKRVRPGDVAGSRDRANRITIRVDGVLFLAHRLAWLHSHGKWPDGVIDHIDGDGTNNSLRNLRDVSQEVNQQNQRRPQRRNTTGLLGVCANRRDGTFYAQINVNGKTVRLGTFETAELAHNAYIDAKRAFHEGCTI